VILKHCRFRFRTIQVSGVNFHIMYSLGTILAKPRTEVGMLRWQGRAASWCGSRDATSQGFFNPKGSVRALPGGAWYQAMKYQCVKCQETWGEGSPEEEGYSHGLCLTCLRETLTPTVRRRQIREGNFDCFGRASCYCDQSMCKYRGVCLREAQE